MGKCPLVESPRLERLLKKKDEIMLFTVTWVDLEIIMLSEVQQRRINTM